MLGSGLVLRPRVDEGGAIVLEVEEVDGRRRRRVRGTRSGDARLEQVSELEAGEAQMRRLTDGAQERVALKDLVALLASRAQG